MNGRIYDPNLGRFMTADSIIPDADDSQSFNRYSYVFNNPLTMIDPDGHCPVCIIIIAVAGGAAASAATTIGAAIAIGAVFGAMAAGVASDGDPRAMLQGAVIGGIMGGIGFRMTQGGVGGVGGAGAEKSTAGSSYWNMYAQAGQSTTSDVVQLETVEVIGRRTIWDRLYAGVAKYGSAAAIGANAFYTAINQNAVASTVAGFLPGYTLVQALTASEISYSAVAFGIIDAVPGAGKIASFGIRGVSRGLEHLGAGKATGEIVQRWMSRSELEATRETGLLRGGRDGTHYVTDSANVDPLRAQQRLSLPKTPEVRVTLEVPKGVFSQTSRVDAAFNMPGGGMERTATGNIPARILRIR